MKRMQQSKSILIGGMVVFSSFFLVFFSYVMELVFKENAFQVKQVAIVGEYSRVDLTSLEVLLKQYLGAGFFMLDAENLRQKIADFPWVQKVKVSRIWPNKLTIDIRQKKVLGRWDEGGYVDEEGQLFVPSREPIIKPAVEFSGDKTQLLKMVSIYNEILSVFNANSKKIAIEHLDRFGNIVITTVDGQEYIVGDTNYNRVLRKFFESYQVVVKNTPNNRDIKVVDMRYNNGFAIQWKAINEVGT